MLNAWVACTHWPVLCVCVCVQCVCDVCVSLCPLACVLLVKGNLCERVCVLDCVLMRARLSMEG